MKDLYIILYHFDNISKYLMTLFPKGNVLTVYARNIESVKLTIVNNFTRANMILNNITITDVDDHTFTVKFSYMNRPEEWITCEWIRIHDHVMKNRICSVAFEGEIQNLRSNGKYSIPRYHTTVNQC